MKQPYIALVRPHLNMAMLCGILTGERYTTIGTTQSNKNYSEITALVL